MMKLKILRWRNYSGLSMWPEYNHEGSYKRAVSESESLVKYVTMGTRWWSDMRKDPRAKARR